LFPAWHLLGLGREAAHLLVPQQRILSGQSLVHLRLPLRPRTI